ncbi:glycosyl hydrolase family 8 [Jeongeupia chitinilytica]|uniref:cellulase n=1 Tax=Jeongeupia chitinilytica TaxID=1041641 RepID=A0ABQ3H0L6_9NEIS|nr:glycosyl hydrolase family 8 [Jeongeupia chitinilytica]GHD64352.1 endoglucanase [Jeongeupia chitinilytica]
MIRRWLLALALLLPVTGHAGDARWDDFVTRFVAADGRVTDTGNGGISHSEGQGYTLLLAVAQNDRATFGRVWTWTRSRLQTRGDALFSWQWKPDADGGKVGDRNNASDGDLLIAWALLRGAQRWQQPGYRAEALKILADVRGKLIKPSRFGPLLMPAEKGFDRGPVVNPSYWLFPAFAEFARADRAPVWAELRQSGLALLAAGRFGQWQLPPDWLQVSDTLAPAMSHQYGYNALRVPLYLAWAGLDTPERIAPFLAFWDANTERLPAWTDLGTNAVDPDSAQPGLYAIVALVRQRQAGGTVRFGDGDNRDYYPAVLDLLSRQAAREARR